MTESTTESGPLNLYLAQAVRVNRNPGMPGFDGDHWRCTLKREGCGGRGFAFFYSMGRGHLGRAPTVRDVLSCLQSDLAIDVFDDYAELEIPPSSRRRCKKQMERFRGFLDRVGIDVDAFIENEEIREG